MNIRNVPLSGGRYWASMLAAGMIGTSLGDFLSKGLELGSLAAVAPVLAILGVLLFAEARFGRTTEAWYWAAIVLLRAAATDLADGLARTVHVSAGMVSATLAVALVVFVWLAHRHASASPVEAGHLPVTGVRYWSAMLVVSIFGTAFGDFVAEGLHLGSGWGSLVLAALFAAAAVVDARARRPSAARYWIVMAIACTAGTVMADVMAGEEGMQLGLRNAAGVMLAVLVALRVFPRAWDAAQGRWPALCAIWGVARNDVSVWLRSPAAIGAALLPALGMGMLVAMLTASVGRQPVALVVDGQGRLAQRIAKLIEGDKDAYLLERMKAPEAERALAEQRVAAVIVVPEDFDERVARWDAKVDVYLNNINIDISDDLRRAVTRSIAEFDAPQLGILGELQGPSQGLLTPNPYRIAIAEHDTRETEVSFLQYQVIPIILLVVISVGLLGTALLTAREFERGTAKILLLSPAARAQLMIGRLVGGTLITAALVTPLIALGFLTSAIPWCHEESGAPLWVSLLLSPGCGWMLPVPSWSHALALLALLLAVTLASVGLGTLVGVAFRDARIVTMAGLNLAAYLFFLGGGFTTVPFLPDWIQTVSQIVPTSYAINGLRQALFYPELIGFTRDLTVLLGFAAATVLLGSLALARAWRRA